MRDAVAALTQVEEREDVAALALEEILGASGHTSGVPLFMLPAQDPHSHSSLPLAPGPQGFGYPGSPVHHPVANAGAPGAGSKARGGLVGTLSAAVGRSLRPWREILHPSEVLLPLLVLSLGMGFYQQVSRRHAGLTPLLKRLFFCCAGPRIELCRAQDALISCSAFPCLYAVCPLA